MLSDEQIMKMLTVIKYSSQSVYPADESLYEDIDFIKTKYREIRTNGNNFDTNALIAEMEYVKKFLSENSQ